MTQSTPNSSARLSLIDFPIGDRVQYPAGNVIRWVFLRGLGLIYMAAFWSMATQIKGLIGVKGILPLQDQLDRIALAYREGKYLHYPTLFWFDASDTALQTVCLAGIGAALMVIADVWIVPALFACYGLYLSITVAGQDFTGFQWDVFLLESGFLAIFLTGNSSIIYFLYRLLIARFMFMAGVVKIAGGDPAWAHLTALSYHYWTQPLPSPLGYYAYFFPDWWQQFCTAVVLIIELLVPFFAFFPRPFRLFSAFCFIVLQLSIVLTGSYTFFNLLTLWLYLFLFDDRDVAPFLPVTRRSKLREHRPVSFAATFCSGVWAAVVVSILLTHVWIAQTHRQPVKPLRRLLEAAADFAVVNNYGPFAVMTTERNEIILEGSHDGVNWREYGFKYKPDALDKPLRWNIPHQPRLDWQMWFAALGPAESDGWFDKFMRRLKEGSPDVTGLLADNPFAETAPVYLRAVLYRYAFTTPDSYAATGKYWRREKIGKYYEIKSND